MKLEVSNLDSGIKQIKLVGRLDLKGTNEIDNLFTSNTSSVKASVLVDMSGVEFLASIGVRMLLANAKILEKRGGKMVLFNPNPLIKHALITAGFDMLVPIYDDFNEACAALKIASE